MVFESGTLNTTLVLAADGDNALLLELRKAFAESVARQLDLLRRARCDANWTLAASRLHAIAASFHAKTLVELAEAARNGAPGDPAVLRQIATFVDRVSTS